MTTEQDRWARAIGQWARTAAELLDRSHRADLAEVCRSLGRRIDDDVLRVLVAGDFKQGKSTLVNALVGDDACCTEVTTPTSVPTVCTYATRSAARVIERRASAIRRRDVTQLEARAAQEGTWTNAVTVELDLPSSVLRSGLEIVDCPPASHRHAARTATLEAARSADAALLLSDAAQPLTEPEVGLLSELSAVLPTTLVVTKCDLVPHWREVVAENRAIIERYALSCELVTVAARIHPPGDGPHDPDAADSGIDDLVGRLREVAGSARRDALLTEASVRLARVLDVARGGLQLDLDAFGDRSRLRQRVQQAEIDLQRCESLRHPSATWQRLLDAQCDEISMDLRDRAGEGLREVLDVAMATLQEIDPAKDWETFEPWLRDAAGVVASDVIAAAESRVQMLAQQVTQAFADSESSVVGRFSQSTPGIEELPVTRRSSPDGRVTRFVREGFATLGSTSAGLLAFATLGGVLSAAVLAPVTVIVGAALGGTAVVAERHSERMSRQQRAADAIERFLAGVREDVEEILVAGLADFRTRTIDQLIARTDQLVGAARTDLAGARQALEDAEAARDRLAETSRNIADIDDLLERIRRPSDAAGQLR